MELHQNLHFRVMEQGDLEDARLMHNELSTLLQLSDVWPVSPAEQQQWFERVSTSSVSRRFAVRNSLDNSFVGLFRLDRIDRVNGSAQVGLDICRDQRGKGHASVIYEYFLGYLFLHMRLNRVELVTLESNTKATSLYRKLGFVEEGRLRQAIWRNGLFHDLIMFSLLFSEYAKSRDIHDHIA